MLLVVELDLAMDLSIPFSFIFYFDKFSLIFMYALMIISSCVFWYAIFYMKESIPNKRFFVYFISFVSSMILLIFSGNLITSIVGWDGLGLTSFLLILYFYSYSSLQSGLLTYFSNRIGDCFFILTIISFQMYCSQTNLIPFFKSNGLLLEVISTLIFFTCITKSAQLPFSAWLPAAMAAPTPVSSLVHSSTLVTAGIYLMIRYYSYWSLVSEVSKMLLIVASATMIIASMSALGENDLKKIVAMSTLSQLGFIMFTLSLGLVELSFVHLIIHAFFKALLFMVAGVLVHSNNNCQDIREISISNLNNPTLNVICCISIMSLVGWPFLSGFYSKDLIVDKLLVSSNNSLFILCLLYCSIFLTMVYSIRLTYLLLIKSMNWESVHDDEYWMPMLLLAFFANFWGSMMYWCVVPVEYCVNGFKTKMLLMMNFIIGSILFSIWEKIINKSKIMYMFLDSKAFSTFLSWYSMSKFNMEKKKMMSQSLFGGFPGVSFHALIKNIEYISYVTSLMKGMSYLFVEFLMAFVLLFVWGFFVY
uniref:NADH-ubiquinone oxidoreductase chain 5 n=1 Tax=Macrogyropus costalimai TaxID=1941320 RepID=A0A7S5WS45_9NEOP|nr:NADH dehydrogenase subunit 5 [Macrogyropus costalimai]